MIPINSWELMAHDLDEIKLKCSNLGINLIKEKQIYHIYKKSKLEEDFLKLEFSRPFVQLMQKETEISIHLQFTSASRFRSLRTSEIVNVSMENGNIIVKTQNSTYIMKES